MTSIPIFFLFFRMVLFCSKIALLGCIVFVFGPIFHEMFIFWWTNMVNSPSKTRDMGMCQTSVFLLYERGNEPPAISAALMSTEGHQEFDPQTNQWLKHARTLMNYRVTCEVRTAFLKKLMFKGSLPTRFV